MKKTSPKNCILVAKSLLGLTIFLFLAQLGFAQQWSMGYYTSFDGPAHGPQLPPNAIEWRGLTHVIYTGGNILGNGTVDISTYNFPSNAPSLISNAHANGVKVIFGLIQCNWCPGYSSNNIQNAISNNLSGLVSNIMNVVNTYGFDGVDVDWEPYSSGSESQYMFQLLSALRNRLGSKVITATAMWEDQGGWVGGIQYLDRLNIMTYDLSVPSYGWPYSWFNAALYGDPSVGDAQPSLDLLVTQYQRAGIPLSKLGVGIPFYGWYCNNVSAPRQTAGWSSANCNQVYYHHIGDQGFNISNPNWDSTAQVPWVYQQGSWLNFDNSQSVAAKVNYAQNKGLGGWIIWELVGDYFPSQTPTQPLLDAIAKAMNPSATSSAPSTTSSSPIAPQPTPSPTAPSPTTPSPTTPSPTTPSPTTPSPTTPSPTTPSPTTPSPTTPSPTTPSPTTPSPTTPSPITQVLIPAINSGGTVNGASFSSSVASGSIAAIFGSSLTDNTACMPPRCGPSFDANGNLIPTLAGAQVTFNGFPAPILSTPSSSQINVQVPVEVAGDPSAAVQVSLMGQDSASTTVSLAPLSPGLMSLDSTGAGQGLILNDTEANQGIQSFAAPEGSAPNSHPAAAGDVIEIYATGLGAVTPPVATGALPQGLAQTIVSPIVTIGGIPATVVFSGLANCCVGLNQVNVVVPDGIAPSDAAPILLSVGGVPSNVVTVAVQ